MRNGVPSDNQSSAGGKRRILLRDHVRLGIPLGADELASVAPAGSGSVQREIEAPCCSGAWPTAPCQSFDDVAGINFISSLVRRPPYGRDLMRGLIAHFQARRA